MKNDNEKYNGAEASANKQNVKGQAPRAVDDPSELTDPERLPAPACSAHFWDFYNSLNEQENYLDSYVLTVSKPEDLEPVSDGLQRTLESAGGRAKALIVFYKCNN